VLTLTGRSARPRSSAARSSPSFSPSPRSLPTACCDPPTFLGWTGRRRSRSHARWRRCAAQARWIQSARMTTASPRSAALWPAYLPTSRPRSCCSYPHWPAFSPQAQLWPPPSRCRRRCARRRATPQPRARSCSPHPATRSPRSPASAHGRLRGTSGGRTCAAGAATARWTRAAFRRWRSCIGSCNRRCWAAAARRRCCCRPTAVRGARARPADRGGRARRRRRR